jgi:hypothetical protein
MPRWFDNGEVETLRPASNGRAMRSASPIPREPSGWTRDPVAATGIGIRTLAWLTIFWGANRGANDHRHRATASHVQPLSSQLNGMSGDAGPYQATLRECFLSSRSRVRVAVRAQVRGIEPQRAGRRGSLTWSQSVPLPTWPRRKPAAAAAARTRSASPRRRTGKWDRSRYLGQAQQTRRD